MVFLGTQSESASTTASSKSNGNSPPVVDLEDNSNDTPNGAAASSGGAKANARDSRDSRDESGSDNEGSEGQIRVGKDYQVNPTNYILPEQRRPEQCPERALLVWSPNDKLSQSKLDEYIQVSKEKYGYNAEQALGMLFWHEHDLDRAIQDLANFTPFPDEWTVEDKVLFEQAFQFHGKSFHRIRQMLPDKSIAQLVKYYYGWKKTRTRTSLMDRQARKLQVQREQGLFNPTTNKQDSKEGSAADNKSDAKTAGNGGDKGSKEANSAASEAAAAEAAAAALDAVLSDDEDDEDSKSSALGGGGGSGGSSAAAGENGGSSSGSSSKPKCFNCGILCHVTHATPKGQMCGTCHQYFQRTGHVRPTTAPMRKEGAGAKAGAQRLLKNTTGAGGAAASNRPPKGMYINHDDLVALATGPNSQGEQILRSMDREIVSYKRVVQNNKQLLSLMSRKAKDSRLSKMSGMTNPYPDPASRINAKWSNEELLLGVQGVRKFGKNFRAIAEVIGTKTESHVRSFYVNYRRRYNLDAALKEYEAEHGPTPNDDADVEMTTPPESGNSGEATPTQDNAASTAEQNNGTIEAAAAAVTAAAAATAPSPTSANESPTSSSSATAAVTTNGNAH